MCFDEFIGYGCGHCSPPVLRACPLTTNSHTNPVCSLRADLPVVVDWFCPGCERIMHSRRVLIQEWEHRFMHERGACGCDVEFPNLMRPRVIGAPPRDETDRQQGQQAAAAAVTATATTNHRQQDEREKKEGRAVGTVPMMDAAGEDQGATRCDGRHHFEAGEEVGSNWATATVTSPVPPVYQEVRDSQSGRPRVAVRLSSLYGVEWRDDHAKLHADGRCQCGPADFTSYRGKQRFSDFPPPSRAMWVGQGQDGKWASLYAGRQTGNLRILAYRDGLGPEYPYTGSIAGSDGLIRPGRVPIVGFPIGAGPEGVCHAGTFENCDLRYLVCPGGGSSSLNDLFTLSMRKDS